jgi:hypothetical protein
MHASLPKQIALTSEYYLQRMKLLESVVTLGNSFPRCAPTQMNLPQSALMQEAPSSAMSSTLEANFGSKVNVI